MNTKFTNTEKAGRIMKLLGWICGILTLLMVIAVAIPNLMSEQPVEGIEVGAILLSIALVFSGLYIWVGTALQEYKSWARVATLLLALISLINIPIVTIIVVIILIYLLRGWNETSSAVD